MNFCVKKSNMLCPQFYHNTIYQHPCFSKHTGRMMTVLCELAHHDLMCMSLKTSVCCCQTAETRRNLIATHNMFTSQSTAVRWARLDWWWKVISVRKPWGTSEGYLVWSHFKVYWLKKVLLWCSWSFKVPQFSAFFLKKKIFESRVYATVRGTEQIFKFFVWNQVNLCFSFFFHVSILCGFFFIFLDQLCFFICEKKFSWEQKKKKNINVWNSGEKKIWG